MNTQIEHPKGYTMYEEDHMHDQDDDIHIGHGDDNHGDKKSVLKKVKDKAKKIKESIKEHVGHGNELHDHDHDHVVYDDDEMDTDPETHGNQTGRRFRPGQEGFPRHHEPRLGERSPFEGAPVTSQPGDYQTFDPATARFPRGQDETTLGWSRTDTGKLNEHEERPYAPKNTPAVGMHSGQTTGGLMGRPMGVEKDHQVVKHVGEARHPANYLAKADDPAHTGYNSMTDQSFTPGQHDSNLGERTAMQGVTHFRTSEPHGNYQTQPTNVSHVSGQEDNWGWSKSDTGMLKGSAEMSDAPKKTPIIAHLGRNHGTADEEINIERHGGILGNQSHLEKDPNAVRDPRGIPHAANYEAKVADPTRRGGEAAGVTPILHQLDKMNIYEEPQQKPNVRSSQEENLYNPKHSLQGEKISTGSHNQFSPEPITPETSKFLQPPESEYQNLGHEEPRQKQNIRSSQEENMYKPKHSLHDEKISTGSRNQFSPQTATYETNKFLESPESGHQYLGHEGTHNKSEQEQGSYSEKISSAAAMVADKAKQATSSVTSKLGYGGNSDQHSTTTASSGLHGKQSEVRGYGSSDQHPVTEAGGYGEKISNVTAAIADKAAHAKDVVATKLGYGETHEGQHVQKGSPKGGSSVVETVKGTIAPVYNKVAEVGSSMASKVQGSGTVRDQGPYTTASGPTTGNDKGVSMKQYLSEKLRPGEDDKALSEIITESLPLHKRKEDVSKVEIEDEGKKVTIKGRVTESEEVARHLGRGEDTNYDNAGTGLASPGKGVIDRLKDAANFWYQKGGVNPATDPNIEGKEGEGGSSDISNEEQKKVTKASIAI